MKKKRSPLFPPGKLPLKTLAELLASYSINDPSLLVGPQVGEDAAVIKFGNRYLVAKSDPVTLTGERAGWYAVNINANDIATMGAQPRWFLATLLLPEKRSNKKLAERIFTDICDACRALNITLCGGHTEITVNLDRPIISGHMLGEVRPSRLIIKQNAAAGNILLLTKAIAIEGTAIISRKKEAYLKKKLSFSHLRKMQQFLFNPGISVVHEALAAARIGGVTAMHDPTEGGLATGIRELAIAAGTGVVIQEEAIPVYSETKQLCRWFGINPLGLIASGSLLIAVIPDKVKRLQKKLTKEGIQTAVIGKLVEKKKGCRLERNGKLIPLPEFEVDEITKIGL